jgi:hypothetical protein
LLPGSIAEGLEDEIYLGSSDCLKNSSSGTVLFGFVNFTRLFMESHATPARQHRAGTRRWPILSSSFGEDWGGSWGKTCNDLPPSTHTWRDEGSLVNWRHFMLHMTLGANAMQDGDTEPQRSVCAGPPDQLVGVQSSR